MYEILIKITNWIITTIVIFIAILNIFPLSIQLFIGKTYCFAVYVKTYFLITCATTATAFIVILNIETDCNNLLLGILCTQPNLDIIDIYQILFRANLVSAFVMAAIVTIHEAITDY